MVDVLTIGELARLGEVSPRTLRHYGDLGLLVPAHVDPATGYRWYELGQLADLRRIIALRELGFGLEQVGALQRTDGAVSVEEVRGMLLLRRADIEAAIDDHQEQLRKVASCLDALEQGDLVHAIDIILKVSDPVRMAETTGVAAGFGHEHIHPVFADRLPVVWGRLVAAGVEPGPCVAYYDWPADDGSVVVHLGFEIGAADLQEDHDVRIVELPVCEVATTLHRGPLTDIAETFEGMVRRLEADGYRIDGRSRERYLVSDQDDPASNVTELQLPVTRAPLDAAPG